MSYDQTPAHLALSFASQSHPPEIHACDECIFMYFLTFDSMCIDYESLTLTN